MSLPSYIVNWDEILDVLGDSLGSHVVRSLRDIEGVQKGKGFYEFIPAVIGTYNIAEWSPSKNIIITGVVFSQSAWKPEDNWDLIINDEKIFDNVFTKEMGQQKHWEVMHPISAGTNITIALNNESGNSRDVWCDIEYIDISDF